MKQERERGKLEIKEKRERRTNKERDEKNKEIFCSVICFLFFNIL